MDNGICRSMADVQLISYISNNNLSVPLTQNINLLSIVHHLQGGQMLQAVLINDAYSAILEPFHPLVRLPLCNTVSFILC
jgi:hypothetical protein